jgi:hypothetical protein
MESDGNFVTYNSSNRPKCHTNTGGNSSSVITMQDDGNLVVYKPGWIPIWNSFSHTCIPL